MEIRFVCALCGREYPVDPFHQFCEACGDPLLIEYPGRRPVIRRRYRNALERYRAFLPLDHIEPSLQLGEGSSPLQRLHRLRKKFDFPDVYVKNEIFNPTASFKDRGTVVAVHAAAARGINRIGTVSTGNMGISTSAYGARAGMRTFVFIKTDTSREKLYSAGVHGSELIQVAGDYGRLFDASLEIGKKHGIYFMNSTDAFRLEGYKVIGLEIFEQCGGAPPDWIIAPASSAGHLVGLIKAFRELKLHGFIERMPRFVGVQARGCNPIARAFRSGAGRVTRIDHPETAAQSISNPAPPAGNIALRWARENDGLILDAADPEILEAQRILAEHEGIFCLPASAVTLAGLLDISRQGRLRPGERVVLVITGSGAKNVGVLDPDRMSFHRSDLDSLEESVQSLL